MYVKHINFSCSVQSWELKIDSNSGIVCYKIINLTSLIASMHADFQLFSHSICEDLAILCRVTSVLMDRRKCSEVWLNFAKSEAEKAKCNICGKLICCKRGVRMFCKKRLLNMFDIYTLEMKVGFD